MLESLYAWIKNIAYYMILVTAIWHIVPNSAYRKYIKFFTGMTLVLLMMSPLMQLFGTDKKTEFAKSIEAYQEQFESMESEIGYLEETQADAHLQENIQAVSEGQDKNIKIEKIEIGE